MSADTKAKLDQAIRDHVADEGDPKEMVISWVLATTSVHPDSEDSNPFFLETADGQAVHATVGLLCVAKHHALNPTEDQ